MANPPPAPTTPPTTPLNMFWFLPVAGDGRYLGSNEGRRLADPSYLRQVALAIDRQGYGGALIPTGQDCEDAWITAANLAAYTRHMRFLVALRPGVTSPTFAARQAAALDRVSEGRLLLNVVCGSSPVELAGDGLFLAHDERYAQAHEYLQIWRQMMAGETVNFDGRYYTIREGRIAFRPLQQPYPPLWFGGSSEPAKDVAAEHIDLYLTYAEPLEQAAEKIASVRRRAEARGRQLRFGLRVHLIVRETDSEAWADAERLISRIPDTAIEAARRRYTKDFDAVGQQRMNALHGYRRDRLVVAPNLWAGIGLVRTGAATALVGDPETVARRLREYQALGIDTVIASGYPHLEECYRVAELLFPRLGLAGADRRELASETPSSEFTPAGPMGAAAS